MKSIKSTLLLLMLLGPVAASTAWADHGHFHGHFYRPGIGVYLDPWPLFYPGVYGYPQMYGYPGPGYYPYATSYPDTVVTPAAPTVYIEQGTASTNSNSVPMNSRQAAQPADWYYCHKPDGYYPYVKSCPTGWQRVPAQPPVTTEH